MVFDPVVPQSGRMRGPVICGVRNDDDRDCIELAARLADAFGEELLLAHVASQPPSVPSPMVPYGSPVPQREVRQALLEGGAELVERAVSRKDLARAAIRLLVGEPADALARLAVTEEASLVVVGATRRRPLRRALVGSVSAQLVSISPCPVAVLPRKPSSEDPSFEEVRESTAPPTVICAVHRKADLALVPSMASQLADALAASLEIVHVLPPAAVDDGPPSGALDIEFEILLEGTTRFALALVRAAQQRVAMHVDTRLHLRVGDAVTELNVLAQELDSVLIVIGTRGRGPWSQALLGSTFAGLVGGGGAPVVVVPRNGDERG